MLEQPRGLRGDAPAVRAGKRSPAIDIATNLVDGGRDVVQLIAVGKPAAVIQREPGLLGRHLGPLRFRYRRDKLRAATAVDDAVGRLAVFIELPVLCGVLVWGVEDWLFKKTVLHCTLFDGLFAAVED